MLQGVEGKKVVALITMLSAKKMKIVQHTKTFSLEGCELCLYLYFVIFLPNPREK